MSILCIDKSPHKHARANFRASVGCKKKRFALQSHPVQPVSLKIETGIQRDHFYLFSLHLQAGDLNHMFGITVSQQGEQQMLVVRP